MLVPRSVQEAHDFAAIAHAATLESRMPFLHFFDGFRTSHEVSKIEELTDDDLRSLIPEERSPRIAGAALTPDRPVLRGTAQNPDTFFQAREAANLFYRRVPGVVERADGRDSRRCTGRHYGLFDYVGHPEAERVIVIMGSGAETVHETVEHLTARGEKVGVLKVRLYPAVLDRRVRARRCPDGAHDRRARPHQGTGRARRSAVSGRGRRTREAARKASRRSRPSRVVVGGRYGLSSKEFTPAMVKAVFDEIAQGTPAESLHGRHRGRRDAHSLPWDTTFRHRAGDVTTALFYGLGADGTVGANKNSIKIIGDETDRYVQGYFVYDSKKSGAIDHLPSALEPASDPLGVSRSNAPLRRLPSVRVHRQDRRARARGATGAVFLLNAPRRGREVWDRLPREVQEQIDRQAASASSPSTRRRWPGRPAWAAASTPSCRPAFSRSPACCRARRRSRRSRRRSRRPTASEAPRS